LLYIQTDSGRVGLLKNGNWPLDCVAFYLLMEKVVIEGKIVVMIVIFVVIADIFVVIIPFFVVIVTHFVVMV
jgi:hypothetical protein